MHTRRRLATSTATALAVPVVVFVVQCAQGHEPTGRAGVLPDSEGAIAEILLQYDVSETDEIAPVYNDLFDQLPSGVDICVVSACDESTSEFLSRWGEALEHRGHDVTVVEIDRPISVWARDRHIARCDALSFETGTSFVPVDAGWYSDCKINELESHRAMAATRLVPDLMPHAIHLEGGNVIGNGRHVFIGANVFDENESSPDSLLSLLTDIAGRPVVVIGDDRGEVPWGHVDMYLTPIDDQTILVASTWSGRAALLEESASGAPPLFELNEQIEPAGVIGPCLDQIAARLESEGYIVHRLPGLLGVDEWMVTYNNVLIDHRGDDRRVFMPVYGISALDARARETYERLGFEVCPVDVSQVFRNGGAVRCIVNVTRRCPDDMPPAVDAEGGSIRRVRLRRVPRALDMDLGPLRVVQGRPHVPFAQGTGNG